MTADEVLDDIYASLPTVACKRLCGDQVCGPIVVFNAELARMNAVGFPIKLHYVGPTLTCGFYDKASQRCRVHAARPLICRVFGAAADPKMICHHGCQPSRWLSNAEVRDMLRRLEAVDGEPQIAKEFK